MRTIYLFLILSTVIFNSCLNKNQININQSVESSINYQTSNKILFSEVENFVTMLDSMPHNRELKNVVLVTFNKGIDSLFVELETCYFYPDSLDGYFFHGAYMIAFYNTSIWPAKDLVNKFSNDTIPKKYKSESEIHFRPFEPRIKKYLFVKPDNLKLIKYMIY